MALRDASLRRTDSVLLEALRTCHERCATQAWHGRFLTRGVVLIGRQLCTGSENISRKRRPKPLLSDHVTITSWNRSQPFWPWARQRNASSTRRRVLQRESKLRRACTEESHHGITGRGLRDGGGPGNRACT